jgi:hypothetical protein
LTNIYKWDIIKIGGNMKLRAMFLATILVSLSTLVFPQNFYVPDFQDEMMGTYMPAVFIGEFTRTNNYYLAMSINNSRYYDVICINKNIVYSNLSFHDQFAINADDVKLFTFTRNNGLLELTDKNGYRYIKISDDTNYYRAYRNYVNNHFFTILDRISQNIVKKTEDGFIFDERRWLINLDVYNYPRDDNFMYFNERRNGEYIGIQYNGNGIIFYDLEPDEDNRLAHKNKDILLRIN